MVSSFHTRDLPTILAMEGRAVGYGFRTVAWRDLAARGRGDYRQSLERFFGRMDGYRRAVGGMTSAAVIL